MSRWTWVWTSEGEVGVAVATVLAVAAGIALAMSYRPVAVPGPLSPAERARHRGARWRRHIGWTVLLVPVAAWLATLFLLGRPERETALVLASRARSAGIDWARAHVWGGDRATRECDPPPDVAYHDVGPRVDAMLGELTRRRWSPSHPGLVEEEEATRLLGRAIGNALPLSPITRPDRATIGGSLSTQALREARPRWLIESTELSALLAEVRTSRPAAIWIAPSPGPSPSPWELLASSLRARGVVTCMVDDRDGTEDDDLRIARLSRAIAHGDGRLTFWALVLGTTRDSTQDRRIGLDLTDRERTVRVTVEVPHDCETARILLFCAGHCSAGSIPPALHPPSCAPSSPVPGILAPDAVAFLGDFPSHARLVANRATTHPEISTALVRESAFLEPPTLWIDPTSPGLALVPVLRLDPLLSRDVHADLEAASIRAPTVVTTRSRAAGALVLRHSARRIVIAPTPEAADTYLSAETLVTPVVAGLRDSTRVRVVDDRLGPRTTFSWHNVAVPGVLAADAWMGRSRSLVDVGTFPTQSTHREAMGGLAEVWQGGDDLVFALRTSDEMMRAADEDAQLRAALFRAVAYGAAIVHAHRDTDPFVSSDPWAGATRGTPLLASGALDAAESQSSASLHALALLVIALYFVLFVARASSARRES